MGSISQLLNTARDALTAQSYGLGVTGQNLANVNTPGYVRREAMLETRAYGTQTTGTVMAVGIRRITDFFLERRQYESTGLSSAAQEHDQRLASLEALFNDSSGTGLGSAIGALFNSFSALAANPSDTTVRQSVLDSAGALAQRVNDTADTIAQSRADLLHDAQTTTSQINESAQAIARLNAQISSAEAQGNDAADLKDQRNRLLLDLATKVDVRTINSSGSIVVQASGATLVDGAEARTLSVDLDSAGKLKILAAREGGQATDVTQSLTGGKLAGIRESRDVDLFDVGQKLDQFVFDVATAVNQQHQQGFGLDGGTARDIFDVSTVPAGAARSLKVSADVFAKPEALAASGSATTIPGGSGNAALLSALGEMPIVFGGTRSAGNKETRGWVETTIHETLTPERPGAERLEGLQVLAWLKSNGLAGRDIDFGTRARISTDTGFARFYRKHAKSSQLNAIAGFKSILHTVENGIDGLLGFGLAYTRALDDLIHKIQFDHWLNLL